MMLLIATIFLFQMVEVTRSVQFTFGSCGATGSTPTGIQFSDTSLCNSTFCDIKCIDGYYVEGLGPLQCVNGTWSSSDNLYCEKECESNLTGVIDHVTANSTCASNRSGVECAFQCQDGYTPSGSAECQGGTWHNASCLLDCNVTNNQPDMDWMIWNHTCGGGEVRSGEYCQYACEENYSSYPTGRVQCVNGSFIHSDEKCILDCTANPPILNIDNDLTNCAGTRSGDLCTVTCLEGYFSPYPSVCYNDTWELRDDNGNYIFFPQYCNKNCVANPSIMNMNETVTNCTNTLSTQFCNVTCDANYDPKPSNQAYCLDDSWESNTITYPVPSCERRCSDDVPQNILNMDYEYTNSSCVGIESRDSCTSFSCVAGYTPQGSLTCDDGTWVYSTEASCVPSSCSSAPSGLNFDISAMLTCAGMVHNSSCPIKCVSGFEVAGNSSLSCQFGSWLGQGTCVAVTTTTESTVPTTESTTVTTTETDTTTTVTTTITTATTTTPISLPCENIPSIIPNAVDTTCEDQVQSCEWTCLDGFKQSTTTVSCNNGTWEGAIQNAKCTQSQASTVAGMMESQISVSVAAVSSVAILSSLVASLSVYSSLTLSTTCLNVALGELLLSAKTLSLVGSMQGMSETQQSMARSFLYVNAMVPPPKLSEDWTWYDTNYGNDASVASSSTVRQRRLNNEDTTTSSRVTLDLAYTVSGLILMFVVIWIMRGSIRIARENLCCCCDPRNEDTRHYLELADDFMLFPNPELCILMLGFTAMVKNIVAPFVVSEDSSEHTIASLLFIFIVVPILLCVLVVGLNTAHRLHIEKPLSSSTTKNDLQKTRQPFLHIENVWYWVDKSSDGKFETEYVKRFGPIFYDFTSTSVKNLVPVFLFTAYFIEGIFFGVVDFYTPTAAIVSVIIIYVLQLALFSLSCPIILHSDNVWKVARILIIITILILAMMRRRESDGNVREDYDVAILVLWVILILLSIARVIYNYLDLIKHGLFSCCGSCCPKKKGEKRRTTIKSLCNSHDDFLHDQEHVSVFDKGRRAAHGGFGGGLIDVAGTMIFGAVNHVMRKTHERKVEKEKRAKEVELNTRREKNLKPPMKLEKGIGQLEDIDFVATASDMNITHL